MGLFLILLGVLFCLFVSWTLGVILIIVGAIIFFIPSAPYGYSSWRGRRGPP